MPCAVAQWQTVGGSVCALRVGWVVSVTLSRGAGGCTMHVGHLIVANPSTSSLSVRTHAHMHGHVSALRGFEGLGGRRARACGRGRAARAEAALASKGDLFCSFS